MEKSTDNAKFKKNTSLAKKTTVTAIVFAVIMALVLDTVSGLNYYLTQKAEYTERAFGYAKMVADYVDADTIDSYLDSLQEDDYYREVQDFMDLLKENSELNYVLVTKVDEHRETYVWVSTIEGTEVELGTSDDETNTAPETIADCIDNRKMQIIPDYYGFMLGEVYVPLYDSAGNLTAYAVAGVLLQPIISGLMKNFIVVSIVAMLLALCISYFMYCRTKKQIVEPVIQVSNAAGNMIENLKSEDNIEIECNTGDEIEELARDFITMGKEIRSYIDTLALMTAEKERTAAELSIATNIQASMLPKDFPDTEYFDICASMTPAKEVGGDFYDFFMLDKTHVAIVVADVSGKGVPAALFMVIAKTLLKYQSLDKRDPGSVFTDVNNALCESNGESMFVTVFEGVLDLVTGEFTFANAGHEPPFIKKADGDFEMKTLKSALVLAAMEGISYEAGSIMLEPGDRIFQYTDGVTEASNSENKFFEFGRLHDSLNRHKDESVSDLLLGVEADINEFVGEAPQFDDLTMLCLDFKKKMNTDDTNSDDM